MLDKIKAMGAMAALMKNQDALKDAAQRVREKLDATRVTGEAGAGAARAIVTGSMRVVSVELTPGLISGMALDERTRELASSLIADAVNDALRQAQGKLREAIQLEARALGLEDMVPDMSALGLGR